MFRYNILATEPNEEPDFLFPIEPHREPYTLFVSFSEASIDYDKLMDIRLSLRYNIQQKTK